MINFGIRTRILVFALVALALGLVGTQLLIRDEARLESLPAGHGRPNAGPRPNIETAPDRETEINQWSLAPPRRPCVGPRGLDLGQEENDDNPRENTIDIRKSTNVEQARPQRLHDLVSV